MAGKDKDQNGSIQDAEVIWEDLVLAVLSVNQYSLEKTYSSYASLKERGLFEPEYLARWGVDEIYEKLRQAGFDRGQFMTKLFAVRLACLGHFITGQGVEQCAEILRSKNVEHIERLLIRVKGIGPRVLANFYTLRGIETVPKAHSK